MQPFDIAIPALEREGRALPELLLSAPTLADCEALAATCQDSEIVRWTSVPSPYTPADAASFITNIVTPGWEAGTDLTWAIREITPEGPRLVGCIDLRIDSHRRASVGYHLAAAGRGKGTMVRALNAVIDVAFDPAGPIQAACLQWACTIVDGVPNWASWKVAWRCGFVKEGQLRTSARGAGNKVYDGWWATLLPTDPREPRAPWDGPTPAGPSPLERGNGSANTAGPHTALVPLDSVGRREGDDPEALVRRFHHVYGLPIQTDGPSLDRESLHMRTGLIAEEFAEFTGAVYGPAARKEIESAWKRARELDDGTRDTVETADALADLIYVIYGMALETGIDLAAVLAEVQRSNMSKLGADGKPIYREDGKVLKGPGYFRPDIAGVLGLGE